MATVTGPWHLTQLDFLYAGACFSVARRSGGGRTMASSVSIRSWPAPASALRHQNRTLPALPSKASVNLLRVQLVPRPFSAKPTTLQQKWNGIPFHFAFFLFFFSSFISLVFSSQTQTPHCRFRATSFLSPAFKPGWSAGLQRWRRSCARRARPALLPRTSPSPRCHDPALRAFRRTPGKGPRGIAGAHG